MVQLSAYFVFQGSLITTNVPASARTPKDTYRDVHQALITAARAVPLRVGDERHILLRHDGSHLDFAGAAQMVIQREAFIYVFDVDLLRSSPSTELTTQKWIPILPSAINAALNEELIADEHLRNVARELEAGRVALEKVIMTELENVKMAIYGSIAVGENLNVHETALKNNHIKLVFGVERFMKQFQDSLDQLPTAFEIMKSLTFNPNHLGFEYVNDDPVPLLDLLQTKHKDMGPNHVERLQQKGQALLESLSNTLSAYQHRVTQATGPRAPEHTAITSTIPETRSKLKADATGLLAEQKQEIQSLEAAPVASGDKLRSLKARHERLHELAEAIFKLKGNTCLTAQSIVKEVMDRQRQLTRIKEESKSVLTEPVHQCQLHMREVSRLVRMPHAAVALVAEINRRQKFKASLIEMTEQYNKALRALSNSEYEQRQAYLQLHSPYAQLWPASASLQDCPNLGLPKLPDFDQFLPKVNDEQTRTLTETLDRVAADTPYSACMQALPMLPKYMPSMSEKPVVPTVETSESIDNTLNNTDDTNRVAELEAQVEQLQVEVLALHAECYLLANPAETDRLLEQRNATKAMLETPPPLDLNLAPPSGKPQDGLSPIPEQPTPETARSVSEGSEAHLQLELDECRQRLKVEEQERDELKAQLKTLQAACEGLQHQLEVVDRQEVEHDLEMSRIERRTTMADQAIQSGLTTESRQVQTEQEPTTLSSVTAATAASPPNANVSLSAAEDESVALDMSTYPGADTAEQPVLTHEPMTTVPRLSFVDFEVGCLALFVAWTRTDKRPAMPAFRRGKAPYYVMSKSQCIRYGLIVQEDGVYKQKINFFVGRITGIKSCKASKGSKYLFKEGTQYHEVTVERWTL